MVKVFTPNDIQEETVYLNREGKDSVKIFLAGTIGGGTNSETTHKINWQQDAIEFIKKKYPHIDITIFNPRREN